jgi:Fe2+ transport system protein B
MSFKQGELIIHSCFHHIAEEWNPQELHLRTSKHVDAVLLSEVSGYVFFFFLFLFIYFFFFFLVGQLSVSMGTSRSQRGIMF